MTRFYAGIGSRSTPPDVRQRIRKLAAALAEEGFTLRSGNADGADWAFQTGAGQIEGNVHIFLPWQTYNGGCIAFGPNTKWYLRPSQDAIAMAGTMHPAWHLCERPVRALHGCNMHIVLGPNLSKPVEFVVCWTPDGAEYEQEVTRTTGGTGMGIRVADRNDIPVFNLYHPEALVDLSDQLGLPPF